MNLDLQGSIERFTLPEIFQLIASGRKSGTLGIQRDDSIVMIYFKEGQIIYGYGPRQTFHLGQLLKEKGIITTDQLEEAVTIQARSENTKRLGEILMSRRYIDRSDLENMVTRQVEDLLYSLLAWQSGSFKFYENQFPTEEEITVSVSVENVILEGLRRIDEMNLVKETLGDLKEVYTISASQGGRTREVSLHANEWNLMALVDGHRTLEEVSRLSHLDNNTALVTLAQLKLAGLITKTQPKKDESSADLEKTINRLAGLFEDYLTARTRPAEPSSRITQTYVENTD